MKYVIIPPNNPEFSVLSLLQKIISLLQFNLQRRHENTLLSDAVSMTTPIHQKLSVRVIMSFSLGDLPLNLAYLFLIIYKHNIII